MSEKPIKYLSESGKPKYESIGGNLYVITVEGKDGYDDYTWGIEYERGYNPKNKDKPYMVSFYGDDWESNVMTADEAQALVDILTKMIKGEV